MKNRILPIILLFITTITLPSLAQQLAIRNYTVEDGLPLNTIYSILQDHSGYIWLATQGGLSRFDGTVFTNYTTVDGLISNDVGCLYEDKNGSLWIGFSDHGGVCKYDQTKFTKYFIKEEFKNCPVFSICEDKKGVLWFGTKGNSIIKYHNKREIPFEYNNTLISSFIRVIYQDSEENFWFGYGESGNGITKFDGKNFTNFSKKNGLINNNVFSVLEDSDKGIWVGTYNGISRIDKNGINKFETDNGSPKSPVISIVENKNTHAIWFGTMGQGLFKYENGKFYNYSTLNGLTTDFIRSIFFDKRGDMWIGTDNGGLCKLSFEKFVSYTKKDGLPNTSIYGINEDADGNIWVCTDGGGVCKLKGNKLEAFNHGGNLTDLSVYSILFTKDETMWLGTRYSGIFKFNKNRVSNISKKDGLPNELISCIKEDLQGNIWIATDNGLCKYNGHDFRNYFVGDGLVNNLVSNILVDHLGNVWLATKGGISKYDGKSFQNFTIINGLSTYAVLHLYEDHKGIIWFATEGMGIGCFEGNRIKNFTMKEGLTSNLCFSIIEEKFKDKYFLYVSTNRGINRINYDDFQKERFSPKVFKAIDGLPSSEGNQTSVFKDHKGNIWFGSSKGITRFEPYEEPKVYNPDIYITKFKINGKDTTLVNGLVLKPDQNYITFEFAGVYFSSPEFTVFKYMLKEGGGKEDTTEINQRSLSLSNLNYGKYKFSVIAGNSDGLWSTKAATIEFEILPPFYLSKWFLSSAFLLVISLVYGVYRYKTEQVQKRNIELGLMVRERTKELEAEMEKSDELLHNILPGSTVDELKAKGFVKPREIKNISILFTDFKGFTYIAGMLPPDMLVNELNDMFRNFDEIITKHGVEKLKTIGDSYMIGAGLPEEAEDHAVRIIEVGLEMQSYIAERNKTAAIKWEMRGGVHSGTVIAGVVGKIKFSYDIWGDTVNIASRMESAGLPGQINISAYTYMLVKDYYECEYRGKVTAKGKGELDMYFVKGVKLQRNERSELPELNGGDVNDKSVRC
ncbi:MAG: two-component regulator propeller domain-containing protein [Ignavibacteria bacterium]